MNSASEQAIPVVQEYLKRIGDQISPCYGYTFKQESCSRWAANEILKLLKKEKDIPPLLILEKFAAQMDSFSCLNRNTSFIFSVAHDTAMDIIDNLLE